MVAAAHRWCYVWRNSCIYVVTDNTQVYYGVAKGTSVNWCSMQWLQELFWIACLFNIEFRVIRIPTGDNILADALSRLNNPDFVEIASHLLTEFSVCCRDTRAGG